MLAVSNSGTPPSTNGPSHTTIPGRYPEMTTRVPESVIANLLGRGLSYAEWEKEIESQHYIWSEALKNRIIRKEYLKFKPEIALLLQVNTARSAASKPKFYHGILRRLKGKTGERAERLRNRTLFGPDANPHSLETYVKKWRIEDPSYGCLTLTDSDPAFSAADIVSPMSAIPSGAPAPSSQATPPQRSSRPPGKPRSTSMESKSSSSSKSSKSSKSSISSSEDGFFGHTLGALDSTFVSVLGEMDYHPGGNRFSGSTIDKFDGLTPAERDQLTSVVQGQGRGASDPFQDVKSLLDENMDDWNDICLPAVSEGAVAKRLSESIDAMSNDISKYFEPNRPANQKPHRPMSAGQPRDRSISQPVLSHGAPRNAPFQSPEQPSDRTRSAPQDVVEARLRKKILQLASELRKSKDECEHEKALAIKAREEQNAKVSELAKRVAAQTGKDATIAELRQKVGSQTEKDVMISELLDAQNERENVIAELQKIVQQQKDGNRRSSEREETLQLQKAKDHRIHELEERLRSRDSSDARVLELEERLRSRKSADTRVLELERRVEKQREENGTALLELQRTLQAQQEKDRRLRELEEQLKREEGNRVRISELERKLKTEERNSARISELEGILSTQKDKDRKISDLERKLKAEEGNCAKISELESELRTQEDEEKMLSQLEDKLQLQAEKEARILEIEQKAVLLDEKDTAISKLEEQLSLQSEKLAEISQLKEQLRQQKEKESKISQLEKQHGEKEAKISQLDKQLRLQIEKVSQIPHLEEQVRQQNEKLAGIPQLEDQLRSQQAMDAQIAKLEVLLRAREEQKAETLELEEKLTWLEVANQQLSLIEASTHKSLAQKASTIAENKEPNNKKRPTTRRRCFSAGICTPIELASVCIVNAGGNTDGQTTPPKAGSSKRPLAAHNRSVSESTATPIRREFYDINLNNPFMRKELRGVGLPQSTTARRDPPNINIDATKRWTNDSGYASSDETPRTPLTPVKEVSKV